MMMLMIWCREAELSEDSDEEMEVEPSSGSVATSPAVQSKTPHRHDLMVLEEAKARSSFFKQAKSFPMFPCKEEKIKWDEYGEPIRYMCKPFTVEIDYIETIDQKTLQLKT